MPVFSISVVFFLILLLFGSKFNFQIWHRSVTLSFLGRRESELHRTTVTGPHMWCRRVRLSSGRLNRTHQVAFLFLHFSSPSLIGCCCSSGVVSSSSDTAIKVLLWRIGKAAEEEAELWADGTAVYVGVALVQLTMSQKNLSKHPLALSCTTMNLQLFSVWYRC